MQSEFDAYGQSYDQEVNKALSFSGLKVDFFTRVKADYLADIVDRVRPPFAAAELLDVGCGTGNLHPLLDGRVRRLAGVDVSSDCIEVARTRNPRVAYETYDGTHLPYPDQSFDVVLAICVFHHIPVADRRALVQEIRRVLRPGGLFVIFEHNPRNPVTMHVVNGCVFDRDAVLLRRSDAEDLMIKGGFRETETRFILTIPAAGRWLRAADGMFSTLGLGAQYYTLGRV